MFPSSPAPFLPFFSDHTRHRILSLFSLVFYCCCLTNFPHEIASSPFTPVSTPSRPHQTHTSYISPSYQLSFCRSAPHIDVALFRTSLLLYPSSYISHIIRTILTAHCFLHHYSLSNHLVSPCFALPIVITIIMLFAMLLPRIVIK